jgi:signal transduction histidine kinase
MAFRVAARTILHLGSELISSDSVAFYELIKNSFDARAPRVFIDVVARIPAAGDLRKELDLLARMLGKHIPNDEVKRMRERIGSMVEMKAPQADECLSVLKSAKNVNDLTEALREANYITISDSGHGMTLNDLQEIYLTIGTNYRLKERQKAQSNVQIDDARPILGEKGVGRLSAMRLGSRLRVDTTVKSERQWNVLEIDWEQFSNDGNDLLEDIEVEPSLGDKKISAATSGTVLRISSLMSRWSREKLASIATTEFARLTDPFTPTSRYPVVLRFNGAPIDIPPLDALLFQAAHAKVEGEFTIAGESGWEGLCLRGRVNYILGSREVSFKLTGEYLRSAAGGEELGITGAAGAEVLRRLGPFKFLFYWFNRRVLDEVEGIGTKKEVRDLVNAWAGGLMLFRDGFRVNPYGNRDDDWLDLDSEALRSSGYKVNRSQIVGKADVSSRLNPALTDQTNREGLCDCEEARALKDILKHVLVTEFKGYINRVDKELKLREPLSAAELRDQVLTQRRQVKKLMALLKDKFPLVASDTELMPVIENTLEEIVNSMQALDRKSKSLEEERTHLLHLASVGMLVEIVVHELWRASNSALRLIATVERGLKDDREKSAARILESQMKTLQRRLKMIDPVGSSSRQVKEDFDLKALVDDVLASHYEQFKRHEIKANVELVAQNNEQGFRVKMVRGMLIQVLENLLANSVYWLKQRREIHPDFSAEIKVVVDAKGKRLLVSDNGPGVPAEKREDIFMPFFTTKPPGEGRGMGLYIASEIASYHNGKLSLSTEPSAADGNLSTFVLKLP